MTPAELSDQCDRLARAGHKLPEDVTGMFAEWLRELESVPLARVEPGITRLIRTRMSEWWPPLSHLLEAMRAESAGHDAPARGCPTCHGTTWIESHPWRANGGHVYVGVSRCPACGVPAPKGDDPQRRTWLRGAELRAWQDAQRPTGDPIHTVEQFQARVREIALRMRVMPRVAKEVSHV